jgi:hypothetical protein
MPPSYKGSTSTNKNYTVTEFHREDGIRLCQSLGDAWMLFYGYGLPTAWNGKEWVMGQEVVYRDKTKTTFTFEEAWTYFEQIEPPAWKLRTPCI